HIVLVFFFFPEEDGIRHFHVTGVQTCALPISSLTPSSRMDWMATLANASLISTRSRSATSRPALASACLIAFAGWQCRELSGPESGRASCRGRVEERVGGAELGQKE